MTQAVAERPGFAALEVLAALAILSFCMVPVMGLYGHRGPAVQLTEEVVYAEILASRILETTAAQRWAALEEAEGKKNDKVLSDLFANDKREDWYVSFKEYRKKLGIGKDLFRGSLLVRRLAPGLMSIEATVSWTPPSGRGEESVGLFRLLGRDDLSMRSVPEVKL